MSDDLHPIKLAWDGRRGIILYEGAKWPLHAPPQALPELYEIMYDPTLKMARVRRRPCDPMDDLHPPEIVQVVEWVRGFVSWCNRYLMMRPRGHR